MAGKKRKTQSIFISLVLLLYTITFFINPKAFDTALDTFINLVVSLLPALALVLAFLFLSNLFIDSKSTAEMLGESSGVGAWAVAALAGLISAGPIYLWYPLLANLRSRGVRDSLLVVFLYNRAVKIPLIPVLVHYFGLIYTLIFTAYMIMFSVINGFVVEKIMGRG